MGINNEDLERQCNDESNWMQLIEDQSQLSSSHAEVPYDLEQLGAYTTSYHLISIDDQ